MPGAGSARKSGPYRRFLLSAGLGLLAVFSPALSTYAADRILVYSGSFDPPHIGHRDMLRSAQTVVNPSQTYVVTNLHSDHKLLGTLYPVRRRMAQIAFAELPATKVSPAELESAFRHDDMRGVIAQIEKMHPGAEIYQVMGEDSYARFLAATRGRKIPNVTILILPRHRDALVHIPREGTSAIVLRNFDEAGYSSTLAREIFQSGDVPAFVLPAVAEVVHAEDLYPYQPPGTPDRCSPLLYPNVF